VRRADGGVEVLHTLNGTATAIGRTLIAIMENHQREDGSVTLPAALHPYLPGSLRELRPGG
jgi:seryl-tRNA synthetase